MLSTTILPELLIRTPGIALLGLARNHSVTILKTLAARRWSKKRREQEEKGWWEVCREDCGQWQALLASKSGIAWQNSSEKRQWSQSSFLYKATESGQRMIKKHRESGERATRLMDLYGEKKTVMVGSRFQVKLEIAVVVVQQNTSLLPSKVFATLRVSPFP